jgi:hypothetical protein
MNLTELNTISKGKLTLSIQNMKNFINCFPLLFNTLGEDKTFLPTLTDTLISLLDVFTLEKYLAIKVETCL